jgi:uncharacterized membrane-anchored protein
MRVNPPEPLVSAGFRLRRFIMFDPGAINLDGLSLIALVFGLTELVKSVAKLDGTKVTILAALMGAVVMVLYQLIGIVPEPYTQVVQIVFKSIAFGLAASGFYKYGKSPQAGG